MKAIPNSPIKKLVLHFDLNKTILFLDSAQNLSKDQIINKILATHAWGKVDEKNANNWKLGHNLFSKVPKEPDQISYKTFVEGLFPFKTNNEEVDQELREKYNDEMEMNRNKLYADFVKNGCPGIKLKTDYDRIMRSIIIPRIILDELNVQEENLKKQKNEEEDGNKIGYEDKNILAEIFSDGKCHLLPVFFKTLIALKKSKREFAIVFRSFGSDLKNTIYEFNKFCLGEHPLYNGRNNFPLVRFDGSKNTKNYFINDNQQGYIYRFDKSLEKITLVNGNVKRAERNKNFEEFYAKELEEENVKVIKGGMQMYIHFMELLKESCALGFQDDYEFYEQHGQQIDAAKPLLIDQSDYSTLQIFFDDNIKESDECIVDVIDVITGSRLPLKKTLNKYLVKIEALDLLKDPDTFIRAIEVCERNRVEEIEKIEKGIIDESAEEVKKTEWELLQESSENEYLRRTVMPLLYPALKIVDMERPLDPISFIALYLLKNKDKVKLPFPSADYFAEKEELIQEVQNETVKPEVILKELKEEKEKKPENLKK